MSACLRVSAKEDASNGANANGAEKKALRQNSDESLAKRGRGRGRGRGMSLGFRRGACTVR